MRKSKNKRNGMFSNRFRNFRSRRIGNGNISFCNSRKIAYTTTHIAPIKIS